MYLADGRRYDEKLPDIVDNLHRAPHAAALEIKKPSTQRSLCRPEEKFFKYIIACDSHGHRS